MTRSGHLEWSKKRALELVDIGDFNQALVSMMSDLKKHPELEGHAGIILTVMLMMSGRLRTRYEVETHIKGFN